MFCACVNGCDCAWIPNVNALLVFFFVRDDLTLSVCVCFVTPTRQAAERGVCVGCGTAAGAEHACVEDSGQSVRGCVWRGVCSELDVQSQLQVGGCGEVVGMCGERQSLFVNVCVCGCARVAQVYFM